MRVEISYHHTCYEDKSQNEIKFRITRNDRSNDACMRGHHVHVQYEYSYMSYEGGRERFSTPASKKKSGREPREKNAHVHGINASPGGHIPHQLFKIIMHHHKYLRLNKKNE